MQRALRKFTKNLQKKPPGADRCGHTSGQLYFYTILAFETVAFTLFAEMGIWSILKVAFSPLRMDICTLSSEKAACIKAFRA